MIRAVVTVLPVWLLVAVSAVIIGIVSRPEHYFSWLPIAFAGAILLTFAIQLAHPRKEGLVMRMMASLGGSVVILAITTAILGALS